MESRDPLLFLQQEISRLREENRTLKEELGVLRSSVRALNALQDIIRRLGPGADVLPLLDDLLASALAVVDAQDGSLLLLDEDTGELVFAVVHGQARDTLTGYRLAAGQGIAGWVAASRKPQIVREAHLDQRFSPQVDDVFSFRTRSLACVPLLDGPRVLGVIEALNKRADREFTDVDRDLLQIVAQLASIALTRAEQLSEAPPAA